MQKTIAENCADLGLQKSLNLSFPESGEVLNN